jgi:hypothetical protein
LQQARQALVWTTLLAMLHAAALLQLAALRAPALAPMIAERMRS